MREIASSVRVVDATNNRITSERLPDYWAHFSALQRLLLTKNALTSLPPAVGSLQNLKVGRTAWLILLAPRCSKEV